MELRQREQQNTVLTTERSEIGKGGENKGFQKRDHRRYYSCKEWEKGEAP